MITNILLGLILIILCAIAFMVFVIGHNLFGKDK
jgi:hypothetical protein